MRHQPDQRGHSLLSAYSADLGQLISRRRTESALRAAAIESATANRAKSEFLANMSHELRTPLNAVIGFGELIQHLAHERRSAGKPREYAGYISEAGKHLLDVINDILNISHIESGKFSLKLRAVDVREIVESSMLLAQRRMTEKRQTVEVRVPENLPPVLADELRLKQVLINLVSNAAKFTDEGGRLCVSAVPEGNKAIAIAVEDNGCGMTPEQIERAVQPFTQIHSTVNRREEGTGLGLTIAKALVMRHRGKFRIVSTPNVGTTVTFTLPVARPDMLTQEAESQFRGKQ
jgi:two-component system, cell cycle sensor histidine kinase PleC